MIGQIYTRVDIKFKVVDTAIDPLTSIEHVIYKRAGNKEGDFDATWVLPLETFLHDFKKAH